MSNGKKENRSPLKCDQLSISGGLRSGLQDQTREFTYTSNTRQKTSQIDTKRGKICKYQQAKTNPERDLETLLDELEGVDQLTNGP
jgi:hypothetical protein